MPFVWASGEDLDAFETGLSDDPTVADARALDRLDGTNLYRLEWTESVERQVDTMIDQHAIVQQAVADESWFLKLRFVRDEHLSSFRDQFDGHFDLHRKYRTTEPKHGEFGLTPEQREVLVVAADEGYFSVPRQATVGNVADCLDISSNSVSQRLRRAHDALVRNTLLVDGRRRGD